MHLSNDLRYAFRTIRRNPGFSLIAIATLAFGIGANTAIFSVFDGILLRPLGYGDEGFQDVGIELGSAILEQAGDCV